MVLPRPPTWEDVVFTATVSTFPRSRKRKQMTPSRPTSRPMTSRALCPGPRCVAHVSTRPPMTRGHGHPPGARPRPLTTPAAAPPCTGAVSASTSSPSTPGPRRTPPRSALALLKWAWALITSFFRLHCYIKSPRWLCVHGYHEKIQGNH